MRIRKRNTAWLTILGVLVALAVLSGMAAPQVAVALLALLAVALVASVLEVRPAQLVDTVQRSATARLRMSAQAQEAAARAARRGSIGRPDVTLLDIGLISTSTTSEGMVMRRTRTVSKDDDGARPYMTLHVAPNAADVNAIVRFEMIDATGEPQYVHEMKTYLREGEVNVLADHQLPLAKNDRDLGAGDGDLRVYLDGMLVGALPFTVTPSVRERNRQIGRAQGVLVDDEDEDADEIDRTVRLQDLLDDEERRARR